MKKRLLVILASALLAFSGLACEMPEQDQMEMSDQEGYNQPSGGAQDMNQGEQQESFGSGNDSGNDYDF
ncbi:MAG: hypothetical protein ACOC0K_02400 [bacterium]